LPDANLPVAFTWEEWTTHSQKIPLPPRLRHFRGDFEPQSVEADETGGVILIISFRRIGLHRGDSRIVKAEGRFSPRHDEVAFVKFHAHRASDISLALGYQGLQGEAFRSEPIAVVNQLGVTRD